MVQIDAFAEEDLAGSPHKKILGSPCAKGDSVQDSLDLHRRLTKIQIAAGDSVDDKGFS